jgi:hypothetical protein
MENREQQILSEIKAMMESIRAQIELLDAKMVELQQCVDPEEFDNNPIELDIDMSVASADETEDEVVMDDLPEPEAEDVELEEIYETESESDSEPELESEEAVIEESVHESVLEPEYAEDPEENNGEEGQEEDDDLPGVFDQPVPLYQAAQNSPAVKPSVAEVMAENHPWRTDMPGTPVKDVRSAISLNDRIIFINYLFDEDPMAFQNAITQINTMTSLEQVVEYVKMEHPEWDLNSELVYRFMMAVRRRVK